MKYLHRLMFLHTIHTKLLLLSLHPEHSIANTFEIIIPFKWTWRNSFIHSTCTCATLISNIAFIIRIFCRQRQQIEWEYCFYIFLLRGGWKKRHRASDSWKASLKLKTAIKHSHSFSMNNCVRSLSAFSCKFSAENLLWNENGIWET